jgi:hypothetical protein
VFKDWLRWSFRLNSTKTLRCHLQLETISRWFLQISATDSEVRGFVWKGKAQSVTVLIRFSGMKSPCIQEIHGISYGYTPFHGNFIYNLVELDTQIPWKDGIFDQSIRPRSPCRCTFLATTTTWMDIRCGFSNQAVLIPPNIGFMGFYEICWDFSLDPSDGHKFRTKFNHVHSIDVQKKTIGWWIEGFWPVRTNCTTQWLDSN